MTRLLLCIVAAALATVPPQSVRAEAAPALSAEDKAAIDLASARGMLLYAYDQAAWHGTDDALAKLGDAKAKVGGWIVAGSATSPEFVFFDRAPVPQALYVARFDGGRLVSGTVLGPADDRSLSPDRQRLIAARQAALKAFGAAKLVMCAPGSPNTVVLPPTTPDGPVLVYLLTPQPDLKTIPFGGHYRIEVAADGSTSHLRPFTKACLNMPIAPLPGAAGGTAVISHLLDPTPTEIHVFSSLAMHRPVLVVLQHGGKPMLWQVDGSAIRPPIPLRK